MGSFATSKWSGGTFCLEGGTQAFDKTLGLSKCQGDMGTLFDPVMVNLFSYILGRIT
jgi:hypothetical protein